MAGAIFQRLAAGVALRQPDILQLLGTVSQQLGAVSGVSASLAGHGAAEHGVAKRPMAISGVCADAAKHSLAAACSAGSVSRWQRVPAQDGDRVPGNRGMLHYGDIPAGGSSAIQGSFVAHCDFSAHPPLPLMPPQALHFRRSPRGAAPAAIPLPSLPPALDAVHFHTQPNVSK